MLKRVKTQYITTLEWSFKISYLLLALSTFNVFLYSSSVQPLLVKLCLVLGALTLFGRVLFFRNYLKTPHWILLALFCCSFLLSIFMNRSYGGASADFKWLIWTGFLFFLLYVCDATKSVKSYKKEFAVLSHIMIVYGTIAAAVGMYMLFNLYQMSWFTPDKEQLMAGFWWGRLWGVYTDPNYGGIFSVVVILLSVYFLRKVKGWRKAFYIPAIVVNFFYMACSDSRTAEISLIAAVCFWILYTRIFKYGFGKRLFVGLIISAVCAAMFIGGTALIKNQFNKEVQKQISILNAKKVDKTQIKKNANAAARKKNLQADASNGRLGLWESGIEVWMTSPIYGTGYNSFLPYVKQNVPDTYVVNNSQGEYVSLHNGYLNVLVYQGLIGGAILISFMFFILRQYQKGIRKVAVEDRDYVAVLSACVLVVGIAMVLLLEGIYTNSPGTFVLWTFLGYLMHIFVSNDKAEI